MIDGLELINFQSHPHTVLEFHPGINAITGTTDHGKTAILRALYWARYNAPAAVPFISHWALNDDGNQVDDMSVTVHKDDKTLVRTKGKNFNGYTLTGLKNPLEALGKGGLPVQVLNFFNMTEVNIQKQLDQPFLIGSTPPEIARFLNTIVDMTEIDAYLSAALKKQRSNTKDVKRWIVELAGLEKELEKYDSLDDVHLLMKKYTKIQKRITAKEQELQDLNEKITIGTTLQDKLALLPDIPAIEALLKKVEPIIRKKNDKVADLKNLTKKIAAYDEAVLIIESSGNLKDIEAALKRVKVQMGNSAKAVSNYARLCGLINDWNHNTAIVKAASKEIIALEKLLPKTCPLCGGPLKKEK